MDLFRCNSLSGWEPRSIQSILCRASLQRVKALLLEISSEELSGNQKWFSPSEAPDVSPPWFSPRHWERRGSTCLPLGSKLQLLITEMEVDAGGEWSSSPCPSFLSPSQPGGWWQRARSRLDAFTCSSPWSALGQTEQRRCHQQQALPRCLPQLAQCCDSKPSLGEVQLPPLRLQLYKKQTTACYK